MILRLIGLTILVTVYSLVLLLPAAVLYSIMWILLPGGPS